MNVNFPAAQARLAGLTRGGLVATASGDAYRGEITGLARAGPLAFAPGVSRLAQMHLQDLTAGDDWAQLVLRWEVTGPDSGLFPVLDADITLTPAGEHAAYRLPPGTVGADHDRTVVHRAAGAIIRGFINRIAEAISNPVSGAKPATKAGQSFAVTARLS